MLIVKRSNFIFLFVLSFIFSFVVFYMCQFVYCDEVWVYGFSYNISKGMLIYRDFDVLQMPLYFFIVSIFLKIFGNYLIVMHIFDSLLFAMMICLISKIIGKKVIVLIPLFMFWWPSGYNLLCLFLLILIIFLINSKKDNDYLIALLLGLCFITKQNIGVFLFIPCLFYSKHKIKSILMFVVPFIVVSLYMLYQGAFYNFIDHCFLGMIEFGEKNSSYNLFFVLVFIFTCFWLVFLLFKNKFRDKEAFYILMFQLMVYPIFDLRHTICAFFPVVYLMLKKINNSFVIKCSFGSILALFMSSWFLAGVDISMSYDNNILFLRNSAELDVLAEEVYDYVDGSDNFFFADWYTYFIKLYHDIPIGQYDLMLSGNVGYNGMNRKFSELDNLCLKENCYFFVRQYRDGDILGDQYKSFKNYIINNYEKTGELFEFDVYTSDI